MTKQSFKPMNPFNNDVIERMNKTASEIEYKERRFQVAKEVLIKLIDMDSVQEDALAIVKLYPSLADEDKKAFFGEILRIEDVPNYVIANKAISLADMFMKILNK